jgi:hypothetical protein
MMVVRRSSIAKSTKHLLEDNAEELVAGKLLLAQKKKAAREATDNFRKRMQSGRRS